MFYFFLFKQKTAYELRISDWSSDVCSSDLCIIDGSFACHCGMLLNYEMHFKISCIISFRPLMAPDWPHRVASNERGQFSARCEKIGRASCRERVCQYV